MNKIQIEITRPALQADFGASGASFVESSDRQTSEKSFESHLSRAGEDKAQNIVARKPTDRDVATKEAQYRNAPEAKESNDNHAVSDDHQERNREDHLEGRNDRQHEGRNENGAAPIPSEPVTDEIDLSEEDPSMPTVLAIVPEVNPSTDTMTQSETGSTAEQTNGEEFPKHSDGKDSDTAGLLEKLAGTELLQGDPVSEDAEVTTAVESPNHESTNRNKQVVNDSTPVSEDNGTAKLSQSSPTIDNHSGTPDAPLADTLSGPQSTPPADETPAVVTVASQVPQHDKADKLELLSGSDETPADPEIDSEGQSVPRSPSARRTTNRGPVHQEATQYRQALKNNPHNTPDTAGVTRLEKAAITAETNSDTTINVDSATAISNRLSRPVGDQSANPTTTNLSATSNENNSATLRSNWLRSQTGATDTSAPMSDTGRIDRIRFVQRVAKAFQATGDNGEVRLRLSPPELGSLRLEVSVKSGMLVARIEAETIMAREVLMENLPALRERLAQQDIRIEQFDVSLMDHSPQGNSNHTWQQQQEERFQRPANKPDTDGGQPSASDKPDDTIANSVNGEGKLNIVI